MITELSGDQHFNFDLTVRKIGPIYNKAAVLEHFPLVNFDNFSVLIFFNEIEISVERVPVHYTI